MKRHRSVSYAPCILMLICLHLNPQPVTCSAFIASCAHQALPSQLMMTRRWMNMLEMKQGMLRLCLCCHARYNPLLNTWAICLVCLAQQSLLKILAGSNTEDDEDDDEEPIRMPFRYHSCTIPARQLSLGWNTVSGAWKKIQSARISRMQKAATEQQSEVLEECFSCCELNLELCVVSVCMLVLAPYTPHRVAVFILSFLLCRT